MCGGTVAAVAAPSVGDALILDIGNKLGKATPQRGLTTILLRTGIVVVGSRALETRSPVRR